MIYFCLLLLIPPPQSQSQGSEPWEPEDFFPQVGSRDLTSLPALVFQGGQTAVKMCVWCTGLFWYVIGTHTHTHTRSSEGLSPFPHTCIHVHTGLTGCVVCLEHLEGHFRGSAFPGREESG